MFTCNVWPFKCQFSATACYGRTIFLLDAKGVQGHCCPVRLIYIPIDIVPAVIISGMLFDMLHALCILCFSYSYKHSRCMMFLCDSLIQQVLFIPVSLLQL